MTYTLLITAVVALALLVVLRWIVTPRRNYRGPAARAPHAPSAPAPGAGDAWDGAARRRRDLAT
jgi:hypothetical protein